eukprot:CAMPEP_0117446186 /NCGR_PEP_ID=MMETSP0759-20121206/6199_1 /TAXON_ID=63605 /ORGANISM="Percolomonas cosmopolitus, Strain WS" /LENGTH=68 /DNA_ID=CAMNT_0005238421 /DNA_START=603 /DNA_END=809 /DNA_ORIENTATION=-
MDGLAILQSAQGEKVPLRLFFGQKCSLVGTLTSLLKGDNEEADNFLKFYITEEGKQKDVEQSIREGDQ